MSCDLQYSVVHSYFDGELSVAQISEFKQHLRHCLDCIDELAALNAVRDSLKHAQLYERAPASLRGKIGADLNAVTQTTRRSLLFAHLAVIHSSVFGLGLVLVVLILWHVIPDVRKEEDYQAEFAAGIVDAHLRSLLPAQLTNVSATDPRTVKSWFEGKVKFVFPIRNFADNGFALQGGRVDIVQGRTVAALVYRGNQQLFNVFIWHTGESDGPPRSGSRQGYQWIDWRKDKLGFCAVSDAAPADLKRLQRFLTDM